MPSESVVAHRYQLLERLGEGAMGSVWKARDLRFDRLFVAVKILKEADGARLETPDRERLARQLRDAAGAGGLLGVNVAAGILDDVLRGESGTGPLRARLSANAAPDGQISPDAALAVFDGVVDDPGISAAARLRARMRRLFRAEANAVAGLRHDNIVGISDYGEHEGKPFLTMDFIEGRTLAGIIRGGEHPLGVKLHWIEQLCAGLFFAHGRQLVHRDIKPANLMIQNGTGTLKILDFGVVRSLHEGGETTGLAVGTLSYMSPEQLLGSRHLDHRSDIFAVGAVLYELLTGTKAFPPGNGIADLMARIQLSDPRPVTDFVPDIDRDVLAVLGRALRKAPEARYQDLSEMRSDLVRVRTRLERERTEVVDATVVAPFARQLRFAAVSLDAGELEAAEGELEYVLSLDPGNSDALRLTERLKEIRVTDLQATAAAEIRRYIVAGEYERARSLLAQHSVLDGTPRSVELNSELADAERRAAEADRLRHIESLMGSARGHLGGGEVDQALLAARSVLALDPANAAARAIESTASAAIEERRQVEVERLRRRAMVDAAAAKVRLLLQKQAFDEAERQLLNLSRQAPAEAAALRLNEEVEAARLTAASRVLGSADELVGAGRLEDAVTLLLTGETIHPRVAEQLRSLRAEWEQRKEGERRCAALFAEASSAFDEGELEQAIEISISILELDPDHSDARALAQRSTEALATREALLARQREVRKLIDGAEAALESGDHVSASRLASLASEADPGASDLVSLLARIDDSRRRHEEEVHQTEAIGQCLARATGLLLQQDLNGAESALLQARDLGGEDARLRGLREQIAKARVRDSARIENETANLVKEAVRLTKRGMVERGLQLLAQRESTYPDLQVRLRTEAERLKSIAAKRRRPPPAWFSGRYSLLVGLLAVAAVLVVGLSLLWGDRDPQVPVVMTPVTVDLHPWARVRFEAIDGGSPELPVDNLVTPFTVDLPPGRYRLHAENVELGLTAEPIEIEVRPGIPEVVDMVMPGFDPEAVVDELLGHPPG